MPLALQITFGLLERSFPWLIQTDPLPEKNGLRWRASVRLELLQFFDCAVRPRLR
jgi:hypothetical protein